MRVTIVRPVGNITEEKDIAVFLPSVEPQSTLPTKIVIDEVNVNAEFDFGRSVYHQKDCIVGKLVINRKELELAKIAVEVIREEALIPSRNYAQRLSIKVHPAMKKRLCVYLSSMMEALMWVKQGFNLFNL